MKVRNILNSCPPSNNYHMGANVPSYLIELIIVLYSHWILIGENEKDEIKMCITKCSRLILDLVNIMVASN